MVGAPDDQAKERRARPVERALACGRRLRSAPPVPLMPSPEKNGFVRGFVRALAISTLEGRSSFREAFRLAGANKVARFRELAYGEGVH